MVNKIKRTSVILLTLIGIIFSIKYYETLKRNDISDLKPRIDYNLLFISIDTLRADRLNTYGYNFETSPKIAEFSKKAVVFEDAISVSSWTLPTHMSFFTGMFPSVHGINRPAKIKVDQEITMLAELFKAKNYRTLAYTAGGYVSERYGFSRGFEKYLMAKTNKNRNKYDLNENIPKLISDINSLKTDEKFFIFLHTFDVHCPYNSPQPYLEMFNTEGAIATDPRRCGKQFKNQKLTTGHAKYISDRYDGGIRFADTKIGEVFDLLEDKALLDNTIVIITSDHGEEFLEHGDIGHKGSLHRELLQVPLIIYVPEVQPGRIKTQVSTIDLFDTITEMLGLTHQQKTNGQSLWKILNTKDAANYTRKFQFSELDGKIKIRSHINPKGHLLNNHTQSEINYYNLITDPTEQNDFSQIETGEVKSRMQEIQMLEKSFTGYQVEEYTTETAEEIKQLKSLGYF